MIYELQLDSDFSFKMGAHNIYVKIVASSNDGLGDGNHGTYIPSKYTIYINKYDPYSVRLSTFLHEVIHVFEAFYEIKISHKDLNIVGDAFAQVLMGNFLVETPAKKTKKR